jgi:glycosyltransferase involved in cell wall biosynthesis
MRILLTIHEKFIPDSGAAGSTFRIGQQYERLGHEVLYFSMDDMPRFLGPHLERVLFPEFIAAHITKCLRHKSLDVIDGSPGDLWFWAKMARRLDHRPILVTRSHGLHHLEHVWHLEEARQGNLNLGWMYSLYRGGIKLWEVAHSLRDSDLAFLLNQQEADYVVNKLNVNQKKVHIFPNGIPDEFIGLPFESLSDTEESVIRIAQIGTYIQRKGIQYSVPALRNILIRYPQIEVSFIGIGFPELEHPEKVVYEDFDPVLHPRIKVIPSYRHETLPNLLKGHHIKLFSSLSEGFGKALVEAMACGLAPVTTNAAGPMEIVRDGQDAIVVPMRDSLAIEKALEQLITDRHYLEYLRQNAYTSAQRFSWRHIAKERLLRYEEALQSRGHR